MMSSKWHLLNRKEVFYFRMGVLWWTCALLHTRIDTEHYWFPMYACLHRFTFIRSISVPTSESLCVRAGRYYLSFGATNQVHSISLCLKPGWRIIAIPHPLRVVHANHRRLKTPPKSFQKPQKLLTCDPSYSRIQCRNSTGNLNQVFLRLNRPTNPDYPSHAVVYPNILLPICA